MWQMFTPEMAVPLAAVFIIGAIFGAVSAVLIFKL